MLSTYNNLKSILDSKYELMKYKSEQSEKIHSKLSEINSLQTQLEKEINDNKVAITLLKSWATKLKDIQINNLQQDINEMLNRFFKNKYNLSLKSDVVNKQEVLYLVAEGYNNSELKSIDIVLSGAEQQMSGFLIQLVTGEKGSDGLFLLDEAFSSLGTKEIRQVPDLLQNTNRQIIISEHKDELFEDFKVHTINLINDPIKGTTILYDN